MGNEALTRLRTKDGATEGKALLETDHILFRAEGLRLKLPFKELTSVEASDGELRIGHSGETLVLELGAQAEKWAQKILNPKGLLDKLGVKRGQRVSVIGVDNVAFLAELRARTGDVSEGEAAPESDAVFLAVEGPDDMRRMTGLRGRIKRDGAVWVVFRKGQKDFNENDVLRLGLESGLVDVKVVRFSETHTASKFVIRQAER